MVVIPYSLRASIDDATSGTGWLYPCPTPYLCSCYVFYLALLFVWPYGKMAQRSDLAEKKNFIFSLLIRISIRSNERSSQSKGGSRKYTPGDGQ